MEAEIIQALEAVLNLSSASQEEKDDLIARAKAGNRGLPKWHWLSGREVAKELSISPSLLSKLRRDHRLFKPPFLRYQQRNARVIRFRSDDVEYLKQNGWSNDEA